jgi:hypothetical protein
MMPAQRSPRVQSPALSRLIAGAPSFDRLSSLALAVALVLSIVFAGLTASRIHDVERDFQPAIDDARALSAALEATRVLLRDGRLGSADARIARADSQAQRFHLVATADRGDGRRAQMLAYDDAFATYYVAARRAALGLTMSADADGSSAEDASLGYIMLRQNLGIGLEAQATAIEATRPATAPVELAAWVALALLSVATLLRRTFSRPGRQLDDASVAPAEDCYVAVPPGDGSSAVRLHEAVERMARMRLAASVAAAKVAKRNNERQIELARSWNVPMLSIMPTGQPIAGMDVYEDEQTDGPMFGELRLVTA